MSRSLGLQFLILLGDVHWRRPGLLSLDCVALGKYLRAFGAGEAISSVTWLLQCEFSILGSPAITST